MSVRQIGTTPSTAGRSVLARIDDARRVTNATKRPTYGNKLISSALRRAAYIHSLLVGSASLTSLAHSKPPVEIANKSNGDLQAGYSRGRRGNHVFHPAICAVGDFEYRCDIKHIRASTRGDHCAVLLGDSRVSSASQSIASFATGACMYHFYSYDVSSSSRI
jgi:hypothetical protein